MKEGRVPVAEYVVVGADQIVAQDLADAIRISDRTAEVVILRSEEEALAALAARRPAAVILHREPVGFWGTGLGQALVDGGTPHGFLSAMDEPGGAPILVSPFTEATVQVFLEELKGFGPSAEPG